MSEMTLYRPGDLSLGSMTVEELRRELASSMELSAAHLVHLAAIWQELERRGEDLSALRTGMATYLPLIARGELNAHLVVRYAGRTMLLRHLAALPSDAQEKIVKNDEVDIVDFVDGDFVETRAPLASLESRQLRYVITDHIHSPQEQREIIVKRRPRQHRSEILRQAQKLGMRNTRPPEDAKNRSINILMTDEEWNAFRSFTRAQGVSTGGFTREAILGVMKRAAKSD
jgi:hypothetical protein